MAAELTLAAGAIGAIYGAATTGFRYSRARHEAPPLRLIARSALSEGTEWAGAMFMTELMQAGWFPEEVRTLGALLTVSMWLEAIFPKIIGER